MYGCGCWAQDPAEGIPGVGCSTTGICSIILFIFIFPIAGLLGCVHKYEITGTGEQLMKTLLAKTCADRVLAVDDMQVAMAAVVERDFIGSQFNLQKYGRKNDIGLNNHLQRLPSFPDSPLLRGYEEKNAGILAIKVEDVGGQEDGGGGRKGGSVHFDNNKK